MRNVRRLQCQTRDAKVNGLMPLLEGQGEWRVWGTPDKTGPYPDLIRASLRRMLAARPASARSGQE